MGSLDNVIQRGACQIIQQTIEAELATLLKQYDNVTMGGAHATTGSKANADFARRCIRAVGDFKPQGRKLPVAIADGYRESNHSSAEMLSGPK